MTELTFIEPDGAARVVPFAVGQSVMQVAVAHGVVGIIGECGGELTCGTCHVYLPEPWGERRPRPSEDEEDMLEIVEPRRPESRLGCQLRLRAEDDGMTVIVPADGS